VKRLGVPYAPRIPTAALLLAFPALASPGVAATDLRLAGVFGEHMVLQQQASAPLWGWAEPGAAVRVTPGWSAASTSTIAGTDGAWRVTLTTPAAGGPHRLVIESGERIELDDVLIGEVWLCSGQSNMEQSVADVRPGYIGVRDSEAELAAAGHPRIRLFNVTNAISATPRADCEGTWAACSAESLASFSAVGYFFGRELHTELDVPIGLIGANWGGTVAESWTSRATVEALGDFASALADVDRLAEADGEGSPALVGRRAAWWAELERKDAGGGDAGWHTAGFRPEGWRTMELPGAWEGAGLEGFDGLVWFRRAVELPDTWAGEPLMLELGPIDDMDTTWFNGECVGGVQTGGQWRTPRRYEIPAGLARAGRNELCVRVYDWGGGGGIWGAPDQLQLGAPRVETSPPISLAGEWFFRVGVAQSELTPWPSAPSLHANLPTALFNGMIAPLVPVALRGAIWYQGESNLPRAWQYRTLFPAMIGDWRAHWGRGDFPFYFVQIAPFAYGGDRGAAAELREAQFLTLSTANTGMAVTLDVGNPDDIHPRNKQDVGRRLALWALARTYGQESLVCSGPLYRSMALRGARVHLSFEHVGGGLRARAGELTHFAMAGTDRVFHPARAVIEGDEVVVTSARVARPVAVRYAWGAADEPNLFNTEGLPASSFRTDVWPGVTVP
jgi:sialate O-acetylesterase